jgi:hypothetical protein
VEDLVLNRFAISPQFVIWFLWIQIPLGWLLATVFLAGVSGIVHKRLGIEASSCAIVGT